jgi:L-ectoine synthase
MFVNTLEEIRGKGRELSLGEGRISSVKLVTAAHDMGFSMSFNSFEAGIESTLWYKNHWEANYIISGACDVQDVTTGARWALGPGSLYTVGPRDRHFFRSFEAVTLLSIFNPPTAGTETHDEDGAYPPTGPIPEGQDRMFVKTAEDMRAQGLEKVAASGAARTLRMLTQVDGVGFTLSDVHVEAGNTCVLWYKNHWEANFVIAGRGRSTNLTTGESWAMAPGTLHVVGPADRHDVQAEETLHVVSIFSPALQGDEMHDEDGALAQSGPVPTGPKSM